MWFRTAILANLQGRLWFEFDDRCEPEQHRASSLRNFTTTGGARSCRGIARPSQTRVGLGHAHNEFVPPVDVVTRLLPASYVRRCFPRGCAQWPGFAIERSDNTALYGNRRIGQLRTNAFLFSRSGHRNSAFDLDFAFVLTTADISFHGPPLSKCAASHRMRMYCRRWRCGERLSINENVFPVIDANMRPSWPAELRHPTTSLKYFIRGGRTILWLAFGCAGASTSPSRRQQFHNGHS